MLGRLLSSLLVLISGCGGLGDVPPDTHDVGSPSLGGPSRFVGRWEGDVTTGSRMGSTLRLSKAAPFILILRPGDGPDTSSRSCDGCVVGTYEATLGALVEHPQQNAPQFEGWVLANDSAFVRLGRCCDAGEIELHGRLAQDHFRGRWWQVFLSNGASGSFDLRRARASDDSVPAQN